MEPFSIEAIEHRTMADLDELARAVPYPVLVPSQWPNELTPIRYSIALDRSGVAIAYAILAKALLADAKSLLVISGTPRRYDPEFSDPYVRVTLSGFEGRMAIIDDATGRYRVTLSVETVVVKLESAGLTRGTFERVAGSLVRAPLQLA